MSFNSYFRRLRGSVLSIRELFFTLFVIIYSKIVNKKRIRKDSYKLRVLQYSEAYSLGGTLKVVERLSLGLGKSRDPQIEQVLILIDKPEIKEYFEKIAQKSSSIIKTYYINLPSAYFSFKEFYHLKRLIQKEHFDIVHLHLYSSESCNLGILAAKMAGVSVVTTEHLYIGKHTFRQNTLKRLNQHLINKIIVVADSIRESLIKEQGIDSSRIKYIPNCIDLECFHEGDYDDNFVKDLRHDYAFDDHTVLIGTIAAFFERKGHKYLLLSAKSIVKRHPNTKFIFIGEGNYREKLEILSRDLDLSKNVSFSGCFEDVSPYYSVFNLFVLPSLAEGMPLCVLEAMAWGVPVVATAVDGSRELVVDGETGLLVPPKDVSALSKAINYMIEDPVKAKKMGMAGKKRVQRKYNLQENIKQTIKVYCSSSGIYI